MAKWRGKGGPRLLVTHREGALLLERARIHVEGDRVVYHIVDDEHRREYNIPHANLAVLFIGQGTSITQDAARLLGEEKVHLAFTGTGGSPLHIGALTTYATTHHFRAMLPIYMDEKLSLLAARSVMHDRIGRMERMGVPLTRKYMPDADISATLAAGKRFADALSECDDIRTLLGYEGAYTKSCYASISRAAGLGDSFRRRAGTGDAPDEDIENSDATIAAIANSLIDHGNYLCYGIAGAALWALGIPPHMSVFHGKTRAGGLVFDIADSFKDAITLPLAFVTAAREKGDRQDIERTFRGRMINAFDDQRILAEAISTIDRMIEITSKTVEKSDVSGGEEFKGKIGGSADDSSCNLTNPE